MLQGFIKAEVLYCLDENTMENKKISVRYYLDTYDNYQNYLIHHAPKMRVDALKKFANNFTANRRILEIKSEIS